MKRRLKEAYVISMYVFLRILTYPIYCLNKFDFEKKRKGNPFYKSKYVRFAENHPRFYDLSMYILNFPNPTSVYEYLPVLSGEILQVGCGTGLLNKKRKWDSESAVLNVDLNKKYIDYGIKKKRYIKAVCEDICQLKFEKRKFDVIIFARCFHHIRSHKKAFENCVNLLKPHGKIIILDPIILNTNEKAEDIQGGYMVNSSIDGVIWRFTKKSLMIHLQNVLPKELEIKDYMCERQIHITNYNLKYPQEDIIIIIEKHEEEN